VGALAGTIAFAAASISSIEDIEGSAIRDILTGDEAGNRIRGGGGNDLIAGGGGDDTLDGAAGDTLEGGAGDDLYRLFDATARIVETAERDGARRGGYPADLSRARRRDPAPDATGAEGTSHPRNSVSRVPARRVTRRSRIAGGTAENR
jgi:Ca2+-binding RTX toxin-like protein